MEFRGPVAERFLSEWRPVIVHGKPDDGWRTAFVMPRMAKDYWLLPKVWPRRWVAAPCGDILALAGTANEPKVVCATLAGDVGWWTAGGDRAERIGRSVSRSIEEAMTVGPNGIFPMMFIHGPVQGLREASLERYMNRTGIAVSPDGLKAVWAAWSREIEEVLAEFKALLPREMVEHVDIHKEEFDFHGWGTAGEKWEKEREGSPRYLAEFLFMRRNWGLREYALMTQAIRIAPALNGYYGPDSVTGPIFAGRPIEEALRAIVAMTMDERLCHDKDDPDRYVPGRLVRVLEEGKNGIFDAMDEVARNPERSGSGIVMATRPLHRKTVKSLAHVDMPLWRRGAYAPRRGHFINLKHGEMINLVDVLHRRNPHMRPFRSGEMETIAHLMASAIDVVEFGAEFCRDVFAARVADIVMAHRDRDGDLRRVEDLDDVLDWLYGRISVVMTGSRLGKQVGENVFGAAVATLFPEGRRYGRVAKVVDEWHRRIMRLDREYDEFVSGRVPHAVASDWDGGWYPHFLDEEIAVDGVVLRPLVGVASLQREGAVMKHCVGIYDSKAMTGRSMLVSMVSADGRSTAEVCLGRDVGGNPALSISQNRSEENGEPPDLHVRVLAEVVAGVSDERKIDLLSRKALAEVAAGEAADVYDLMSEDDLAAVRDRALADILWIMPAELRAERAGEWTEAMLTRLAAASERAWRRRGRTSVGDAELARTA